MKIKLIDGEYYKEGKYWILVNYTSTTPWIMCSENKSIIRFAARCFINHKYFCNRIYSSDIPEGKILLDRKHARRYTNTKWIGADI